MEASDGKRGSGTVETTGKACVLLNSKETKRRGGRQQGKRTLAVVRTAACIRRGKATYKPQQHNKPMTDKRKRKKGAAEQRNDRNTRKGTNYERRDDTRSKQQQDAWRRKVSIESQLMRNETRGIRCNLAKWKQQ